MSERTPAMPRPAPRPGDSDSGYVELQRAHRIAGAVVDPEIPVLTLEDLGVLRGVARVGGRLVVRITPTYTGCPATQAITVAVEAALLEAGYKNVRIETALSPAWSTDQITDAGRRKLEAFGIAPPPRGAKLRSLFAVESVACPRCGSTSTTRISEFGSTACKAHWRCERCGEPFDAFKCL